MFADMPGLMKMPFFQNWLLIVYIALGFWAVIYLAGTLHFMMKVPSKPNSVRYLGVALLVLFGVIFYLFFIEGGFIEIWKEMGPGYRWSLLTSMVSLWSFAVLLSLTPNAISNLHLIEEESIKKNLEQYRLLAVGCTILGNAFPVFLGLIWDSIGIDRATCARIGMFGVMITVTGPSLLVFVVSGLSNGWTMKPESEVLQLIEQ